MKRFIAAAALALIPTGVLATNTNIQGNVQSRCTIVTEIAGVYGNPSADKLSSKPTDGGVYPIIRVDVVQANSYKVQISWPDSFSTSPTLSDSVVWNGEVTVSAVGASTMNGYEAAKVEFNNTTEYDLTIAGSVWFKVESTALYGSTKSLPGGIYTAVVESECIPK